MLRFPLSIFTRHLNWNIKDRFWQIFVLSNIKMHSILKKNLFSIASNTTIILFTQNIAINSFNLKNERSVFFSTADNLNLFVIQIVSPQKSLANIRLNTAEFFSRKIKKVRSRQHIEDLIFAFCFKIRASR